MDIKSEFEVKDEVLESTKDYINSGHHLVTEDIQVS
ncbi:hypothetical protein Avbf_06697 [Armadillidium vulgare]|nr:hypothetical protein Avbf_06697 [Armadillidium vulgare]